MGPNTKGKSVTGLSLLLSLEDWMGSGAARKAISILRIADEGKPVNAIGDAIAREERRGMAYMFRVRMIIIAILAGWSLTLPFDRSIFYILVLGAFAVLGAFSHLLTRFGTRRWRWLVPVLLLLDALLLSYVLIVPAPYVPLDNWTPQLNLRLWNFLWLGVFLVSMALSYSPRLVLLTGVACISAWSGIYLWVANQPGANTRTASEALERGEDAAILEEFLDPDTVSLTTLQYQIVFLVLVTVILTLTVWRSRRLVRRQASAEAQRSALSRYFSPNIVRELSSSSQALIPARQRVAVLFADMRGFTSLSERLEPEELVKLLSEFHGRLAQIAFSHRGTVDKYIGDAIMVNFGTPRTRPDDAVRALACAGEMVAEIERWNRERRSRHELEIGIGIGVHYGEVLVGNIGDDRRLEYTVLGDTVNVASRLESLTREIEASIVASDDLVATAKACGAEIQTLVKNLSPGGEHIVKGRSRPVSIWSTPMIV